MRLRFTLHYRISGWVGISGGAGKNRNYNKMRWKIEILISVCVGGGRAIIKQLKTICYCAKRQQKNYRKAKCPALASSDVDLSGIVSIKTTTLRE